MNENYYPQLSQTHSPMNSQSQKSLEKHSVLTIVQSERCKKAKINHQQKTDHTWLNQCQLSSLIKLTKFTKMTVEKTKLLVSG